jgi:uncharacterized protein (TIGR02246 family)
MFSSVSLWQRHTLFNWLSLALLLAPILATSAFSAEPTAGGASDETAIRATANAFVEAFDRGDARAVAALWTPNGSLADDRSQVFKGRQAIEDEYTVFFKRYPGAKMEIAVQSIEFPAPGTAIEDGLARVVAKDEPAPTASRYTAVHVLVDGKWLMASVRESRAELPSNYGRLQAFEWLVGNWQTTSESTTVCTNVRWIANKSFLERQYTVGQDGVTTSSGVQIIGWDSQADQVRSWSFDSSGGYGTGAWTPTPHGWCIASTGVLADGTPTSSQDVLIRVPGEDNVLGWRSTDRKVGAVELPDTREVVLERPAEKR